MNCLERLLNLTPLFEEDGGAAGAASESEPSEPAADDFNLDDDAGSTEPESEPSEPAEPRKTEPDTTPETYRVKYNKQEVELTRDQLLEAAQKGLDYDRIRESRDRYMGPLGRIAQMSGMTVDQLLPALDSMIKTSAVEAKKQAFLGQGMDENQAGYFAEMAYENETLKNSRDVMNRQTDARTQAQQELNERIQSDIADFEQRFPDVNELPGEVADAVRSGENPVVAYQGYLIRENAKKLQAMEQNRKNRENAPGSVSGAGGEQEDVFVRELFKE